MRTVIFSCWCVLSGVLGTPAYAGEPGSSEQSFRVRHALQVADIPAGSKLARVWFWLPDDDDAQKVLDLTIVDGPRGCRVARDPANGHRYLYAEVPGPGASLSLVTSFTVRRSAVSVRVDPDRVGRLTDGHWAAFAEYLRRDCPNMEVTPRVQKLADAVCGAETNPALQARRIYDHVVATTNHYSKPGAPKSSGLGSAEYCLDAGGGGCTDQHALFIALARARGIPARLHFGSRLPPANEGKDIDPGYRCWVTYFLPNYGWVPADASAGNTIPGERDFYATGLDANRVCFAAGRDLELAPRQVGPRINLLIGAYVEIDGAAHSRFKRALKFERTEGARSTTESH